MANRTYFIFYICMILSIVGSGAYPLSRDHIRNHIIPFDKFIADIKATASQRTMDIEQNIHKIYNHVLAPDDMQRVYIGQLFVEFDRITSTISISKQCASNLHLRITIDCFQQSAIIHTIEAIPKKLTSKQYVDAIHKCIIFKFACQEGNSI